MMAIIPIQWFCHYQALLRSRASRNSGNSMRMILSIKHARCLLLSQWMKILVLNKLMHTIRPQMCFLLMITCKWSPLSWVPVWHSQHTHTHTHTQITGWTCMTYTVPVPSSMAWEWCRQKNLKDASYWEHWPIWNGWVRTRSPEVALYMMWEGKKQMCTYMWCMCQCMHTLNI